MKRRWCLNQSWDAPCRVWDSKLVTEEPNIRFYAGAPLVASTGHRIGALCGPYLPGSIV